MKTLETGKKYLITTSDWFMAPNGRQYKSVFGTVNSINDADSSLGLKTNRNSTNWYVMVGNMMVAGCQIHYVIETDEVLPEGIPAINHEVVNGEVKHFNLPSPIYHADSKYSAEVSIKEYEITENLEGIRNRFKNDLSRLGRNIK